MAKPPEKKPPEESGRSRREAELEARVAELERLLARAGTGAEPARDRAAPRESEVLYRAILESATDTAIIAMDIDGRVTTWNEGARRIFGRGSHAVENLCRSGRHRDRERAALQRAAGADGGADPIGGEADGARRG